MNRSPQAYRLAGLLSAIIWYGGYIVGVLAVGAFVFGTVNFSEWGTEGRAIVAIVGLVFSWLWAVVGEAADVRPGIASLLLGDDA